MIEVKEIKDVEAPIDDKKYIVTVKQGYNSMEYKFDGYDNASAFMEYVLECCIDKVKCTIEVYSEE